MAQVPPNSMLPLRFAGTLRRLATNSYTVTRKLIGSYVEGRYVSNPTTQTLVILASVQPTTPQDLFRLPEAQRTVDSITVWTETPLQMPDAPSGVEGDVVFFSNRQWQVQRIFDWGANGGFMKVICQKVGQ